MVTTYDRPDAVELVDIVREFLREEVQGGVEGQLSFHVRVAVTALGIVERELRLGPEHAAAQAARLARFGCMNEAALAARIRAGDLDDRYTELATSVREQVWEKLSVMNPRYATPYTTPHARED